MFESSFILLLNDLSLLYYNFYRIMSSSSSRAVKLKFFRNKADGSDKILFVSLIAAIVSQSSDLQTFGLSDGIDNHNLTCSEEITGEDRHKKKDVISGLCVGEVYQFRNLKYFFKDGKLVVIMIKVIH